MISNNPTEYDNVQNENIPFFVTNSFTNADEVTKELKPCLI